MIRLFVDAANLDLSAVALRWGNDGGIRLGLKHQRSPHSYSVHMHASSVQSRADVTLMR